MTTLNQRLQLLETQLLAAANEMKTTKSLPTKKAAAAKPTKAAAAKPTKAAAAKPTKAAAAKPTKAAAAKPTKAAAAKPTKAAAAKPTKAAAAKPTKAADAIPTKRAAPKSKPKGRPKFYQTKNQRYISSINTGGTRPKGKVTSKMRKARNEAALIRKLIDLHYGQHKRKYNVELVKERNRDEDIVDISRPGGVEMEIDRLRQMRQARRTKNRAMGPNSYITMQQVALKAGKKSFKYKGKTYYRKPGSVVYSAKKA